MRDRQGRDTVHRRRDDADRRARRRPVGAHHRVDRRQSRVLPDVPGHRRQGAPAAVARARARRGEQPGRSSQHHGDGLHRLEAARRSGRHVRRVHDPDGVAQRLGDGRSEQPAAERARPSPIEDVVRRLPQPLRADGAEIRVLRRELLRRSDVQGRRVRGVRRRLGAAARLRLGAPLRQLERVLRRGHLPRRRGRREHHRRQAVHLRGPHGHERARRRLERARHLRKFPRRGARRRSRRRLHDPRLHEAEPLPARARPLLWQRPEDHERRGEPLVRVEERVPAFVHEGLDDDDARARAERRLPARRSGRVDGRLPRPAHRSVVELERSARPRAAGSGLHDDEDRLAPRARSGPGVHVDDLRQRDVRAVRSAKDAPPARERAGRDVGARARRAPSRRVRLDVGRLARAVTTSAS